jgi:hypothetical protein
MVRDMFEVGGRVFVYVKGVGGVFRGGLLG